MNGMTQQQRKEVLAFILARLPESKVYLFGPREHNDCQACDAAYLAIDHNGYKLNSLVLADLHAELNNMPGEYSISLYDFNVLSQEEQMEISRHGALLHL